MGSIDINSIFPNGLDLNDAFQLLWPAGLYLLGMVAYAMFIFKFYRFVAARDMFALDLSKYEESRFKWVRGLLHLVMYVAKYIIVFPLFAIFWFAVLTLVLAFLAKEQAFPQVILIALATVSAIRVTAYYREELSRDLAKILPFAVLGIFLVDASFFEVSSSLNILAQAEDHREKILYYLGFLIGLEFALRLLMGIMAFFIGIVRLITREPVVEETTAEPEAEFAAIPMEEEWTEEEREEEERPEAPVPAPALPTVPSSYAQNP